MQKTDIAIIGAGTAGMSAAIYAKRAGKNVVMLEGYMPGGQIVVTPEVDNYPALGKVSGYDFAMGLYNQATELGTEMISAEVKKVSRSDGGFLIEYDGGELWAKALIIATGAKNRKLEVEDEEKLTGYGVSYCATCDGMFFRGRDVAVVGGGSTALQDAEFLSDYCRKVYLIHRRLYRAIVEDTEYVVRQEVGKTYALHLSARLYLLESLPGIAVYSLPVAVILRVRRPMYKEEVYIIEPEIA